MVRRVARLRREFPGSAPRLVELGMGRGRDLIFFSRAGYRVLGIDLDPIGIDRARRRAHRIGVPIRTRRADLRTVRLPAPVEVVYSSATLHLLPAALRRVRFAHFRAVTAPGGLHAVNAFTSSRPGTHPGGPRVAPDRFAPGELARYYADWEILETGSVRYAYPVGDSVVRQPADIVLARKPA
jgi:tellurite methyltransferase